MKIKTIEEFDEMIDQVVEVAKEDYCNLLQEEDIETLRQVIKDRQVIKELLNSHENRS